MRPASGVMTPSRRRRQRGNSTALTAPLPAQASATASGFIALPGPRRPRLSREARGGDKRTSVAQTARGRERRFRAQGPAFAVALLVSVVLGGTLGYHVLEGWGLWHAFYVTVLAITTVELPPLSRPAQPQSYTPPVTPPSMNNIANRSTGPMPAGQRDAQPPLSANAARQHAVASTPARDAMPVVGDVDENSYELDPDDLEDGFRTPPVPEPEAQPLQRPAGQQRQIRRLDRGAELQRGRNTPSGDVIDIPAFLRKR